MRTHRKYYSNLSNAFFSCLCTNFLTLSLLTIFLLAIYRPFSPGTALLTCNAYPFLFLFLNQSMMMMQRSWAVLCQGTEGKCLGISWSEYLNRSQHQNLLFHSFQHHKSNCQLVGVTLFVLPCLFIIMLLVTLTQLTTNTSKSWLRLTSTDHRSCLPTVGGDWPPRGHQNVNRVQPSTHAPTH